MIFGLKGDENMILFETLLSAIEIQIQGFIELEKIYIKNPIFLVVFLPTIVEIIINCSKRRRYF